MVSFYFFLFVWNFVVWNDGLLACFCHQLTFNQTVDSTIASLTPLFSWLKGAPPGINPSSRQQKKNATLVLVVRKSLVSEAARLDPTVQVQVPAWRILWVKCIQLYAWSFVKTTCSVSAWPATANSRLPGCLEGGGWRPHEAGCQPINAFYVKTLSRMPLYSRGKQ